MHFLVDEIGEGPLRPQVHGIAAEVPRALLPALPLLEALLDHLASDHHDGDSAPESAQNLCVLRHIAIRRDLARPEARHTYGKFGCTGGQEERMDAMRQ